MLVESENDKKYKEEKRRKKEKKEKKNRSFNTSCGKNLLKYPVSLSHIYFHLYFHHTLGVKTYDKHEKYSFLISQICFSYLRTEKSYKIIFPSDDKFESGD